MQFYLHDLVRIHSQQYRLAFFEALTTLAVVMGLEMLALAWLDGEAVRLLTGTDAAR